MIPVGYGLPVWLDTDVYLSADEVRDLGSYEIGTRAACAFPGCNGYKIEAAHVARKGMGGVPLKDGKPHDGPQLLVCKGHHVSVDDHPKQRCFAIRRADLAVGILWRNDGLFTVCGYAHREGEV